MIDITQRLAVETHFVRVDQYVVDARTVVAELMKYPAGGDSTLTPTPSTRNSIRHWTAPRHVETE